MVWISKTGERIALQKNYVICLAIHQLFLLSAFSHFWRSLVLSLSLSVQALLNSPFICCPHGPPDLGWWCPFLYWECSTAWNNLAFHQLETSLPAQASSPVSSVQCFSSQWRRTPPAADTATTRVLPRFFLDAMAKSEDAQGSEVDC